MKNKRVTYLLFLLVATVWGIIIYRVVSAAGGDDTDLPAQISAKKEIYNDYAVAADTSQLLLNYRDPFGLVKERDTVVRPGKSKVRLTPVVPKAPIDWNFIQYSGFIRNPSTKKLITLININGRSEMLMEGQQKDNVKLLKNLNDSIKISYMGKIKFISIKSPAL